jgi:hypothetical protein
MIILGLFEFLCELFNFYIQIILVQLFDLLRKFPSPASATTQYHNDSTDAHNRKKKPKKGKVPLQCSSPYSRSTNTTMTPPGVQVLEKRRLQEVNRA